MGAHLLFQLVDDSPETVREVNEWLEQQPEFEELAQGEYDRSFTFWGEKDVQWAIENIGKPAAEDSGQTAEEIGRNYYLDIGEAKIKTSGCEDIDCTSELWAQLFEKLHEHYAVEVYSKSCSLHPAYFSSSQVRKVTNNGDALTGPYTTLTELFEMNEFKQKQ
jgi:hypothetical protein